MTTSADSVREHRVRLFHTYVDLMPTTLAIVTANENEHNAYKRAIDDLSRSLPRSRTLSSAEEQDLDCWRIFMRRYIKAVITTLTQRCARIERKARRATAFKPSIDLPCSTVDFLNDVTFKIAGMFVVAAVANDLGDPIETTEPNDAVTKALDRMPKPGEFISAANSRSRAAWKRYLVQLFKAAGDLLKDK